MSNITIFEEEFDNVAGFKMPDTLGNTVTYTEGGGSPTLETVTKTYTPTASQQTETITPSSGYDGIGEVDVTVDAMPTGSYGTATWTKGYQQGRLYVAPTFENFEEGYFESAPNISTSLILEGKSVTPSETAQTVSPTSTDYYLSTVNVGAIPSDYVGSGVTQRDSTDLTASGATVTAQAGYYESAATKTVASGSEGTPTATKGTVSNHSIAVTPSVTNGTGYIAGGTHTGTAVTVSASELDSGTKSITSNGTGIDVVGYAAVDVNVSGGGNLQSKSETYTPTESQQTDQITADTGYDGLSTVNITVNAISSSYVGSGVTRRSSSDLSANGATVTAPAGYYASQATKTVASGSATTPATTIDAEPVINFDPDTGEMSVALNKTQSVTPTVSAGYVSSGTAGNITVTGSDSFTLDVKGASTYYPSASDQTIAGDQWLSGTQTIKAVTTTNLTAANIKSGVVVEVGDSADSDRVLSVTGTYSGGGSVPAPYTQMNTGSVTIASRYQTTGNRLIVSLANVGFTPKQFLLIATSSTVQSIYNSQDTGTEANGVVIYADYVSLTDGTNTFYARSESRLGAKAMSGGRVNSAWTTQTNNYLYNNGTNIYFRTSSNYGLPANGVYNWIAFA